MTTDVPTRPARLRAEPLRLDHNERLVPAPECVAALGSIPAHALSRYPSSARLERLIADRWNLDSSRVLATAGGDDGIDRICRLCLRDRPGLVTATPTFEMFPLCAGLAGGRIVEVPSLSDPAPLDALLESVDEETGLVVVITPHNPTGAAIPASTLTGLADRLPEGVFLLADLAYAEFADEDPTRDLLTRDRVLVLRTLSKAWGLAGLRVGYVLGRASTIACLRESGPPFPLAGPSLRIAEIALERGDSLTASYVDAVRAERVELALSLRALGAEPFPSQANFVLARVEDAAAIRSRLERRGVRVRDFDRSPDLLRITLPGDPEAFAILTSALREVMGGRSSP